MYEKRKSSCMNPTHIVLCSPRGLCSNTVKWEKNGSICRKKGLVCEKLEGQEGNGSQSVHIHTVDDCMGPRQFMKNMVYVYMDIEMVLSWPPLSCRGRLYGRA